MSKLLKESLHLLRHNKLVWIFGLLSILYSSLPSLSEVTYKDPGFQWVYSILRFVASIVSIIALSCSIYVVFQGAQDKNPTFSEAWIQGKSKYWRIVGLLIISFSMPLLAGVCSMMVSAIIPNKTTAVPFLWVLGLIANVFYSPLITFGICAIVIDGLKVWAAAWTGFQIAVNNFFRVLLVIIVLALIKILTDGLLAVFITLGIIKIGTGLPSLVNFDFAAYQSMLSIPVFRITNIIVYFVSITGMNAFLTLGYLKFTKEIDYPALVRRELPNTSTT
jgi:hypothetical protein